MNISYLPKSVADGREGDASALWNERIRTLPIAVEVTRKMVDEIEHRLFGDLILHVDVRRNTRGEPGWWVSTRDGLDSRFVALHPAVRSAGGAYDTRREIMKWFDLNVGFPRRVVVRVDQNGDFQILSTPEIDVYVIDERAPRDRVYKMTSEATPGDIDLLIGSSPIRDAEGIVGVPLKAADLGKAVAA